MSTADEIIQEVEKAYMAEAVATQLLKEVLRRLDEIDLKIDLLK